MEHYNTHKERRSNFERNGNTPLKEVVVYLLVGIGFVGVLSYIQPISLPGSQKDSPVASPTGNTVKAEAAVASSTQH